jgi:rod shape-determining protein MreC
MQNEKVEVGDLITTSGGDRIFPKGLPIGTVSSTFPGRDVFLNIRLKPAAKLDKLEEVLVVTEIKSQEPDTKDLGPIRAADILAARLPSVPQQTTPAPGTTEPSAAQGTAPAQAAQGTAQSPQAGAKPTAKPATDNGPATTPKTEAPKSSTPKSANPAAPVVPKTATPKKVAPGTTPSTAPQNPPQNTPPQGHQP